MFFEVISPRFDPLFALAKTYQRIKR